MQIRYVLVYYRYFAKTTNSWNWKTREAIDKYCEKFEKDMLNLFDRCYRKEDPKMMHVRR